MRTTASGRPSPVRSAVATLRTSTLPPSRAGAQLRSGWDSDAKLTPAAQSEDAAPPLVVVAVGEMDGEMDGEALADDVEGAVTPVLVRLLARPDTLDVHATHELATASKAAMPSSPGFTGTSITEEGGYPWL
jgi:hypothetical protein